MEWLALHLEMTLTRTQRLVEDTRVMIAESRRILDEYRSRKPIAFEPVLKTCLLCDAERTEMHPLGFRVIAAPQAARNEAALRDGLSRFGVCEECFDRYQGRLVRLKFDLNRLLDWFHEPHHILH